jgi:hypothetical protein
MKNKFIYDPNYLIVLDENDILEDVDDPWSLYVKEEEGDSDSGDDLLDAGFDMGDDSDSGSDGDDASFDIGFGDDDAEDESDAGEGEEEQEDEKEPVTQVVYDDPMTKEIYDSVIAPIAAEAEEATTGHIVEGTRAARASRGLYGAIFEEKQATINIQTYASGIARYIRNYTNLLDIPQLLYATAREYLVAHWGEEWAREFDSTIDSMKLDVAINSGSKGKSSGKRVGSEDSTETGKPSTINRGHNSLTGGLAVGAGGSELS